MADQLSAEYPVTAALVEAMRARPLRTTPDANVLALLELPLPAAVAAWLDAWARHDAGFLEMGDWEMDRTPRRTTDPRHLGDAELAIWIGTNGGGDEFVVRIKGSEHTVVDLCHYDDETNTHDSFEEFLWNRQMGASESDKTTVVDAVIEKLLAETD